MRPWLCEGLCPLGVAPRGGGRLLGMELRVHETAAEFLNEAGEALLRDEAKHNLILRIAHR